MCYFKGDGWYLAEPNQNCIDACMSQNLECSEQNFYQHNSDIDSSSEVLNLFQTLGGTISATSCSDDFGYNSDVPLYSAAGNVCFYSDSLRLLSTFSCAKLPFPTDGDKQRLCRCHVTGNIYIPRI